MTKEQKARLNELTQKMMRNFDFSDDFTKEDYDEYLELSAISHDEYRQREEPRLREYFEQHIKGKAWEQISGDRWDWYSDWHKDVFGYRPRTISFNERNV